jgi:uncharacterized repeat protein (TIGR01451 family)
MMRRLFESDDVVEADPAPAPAPAARRPVSRTESSLPELNRSMTSKGTAAKPASQSTDRYKGLLESVRPGTERPVVQKETAKEGQIRPVSRSSDEVLENEVNPFEPSEKPTKVINAGYESEQGKKDRGQVKPVSATSTSKVAPAAKGAKAPTGEPVSEKRITTTKAPAKPAAPASKSVVAETKESLPVTTVSAGNHAPQVDVKWEARGEVTLGQECQCALIVNNSGKTVCRDLVVEANFPESVRLVDATPFPQPASSKLEWHFSSLAAGESKSIELTIVPTKSGELAASAQVRFTGVAATSFKVSEPQLTTTIKLPSEVRIGDPASATVTISNPGTGTAKNVILKATLPEGLDCKSGRDYSSEIGPLGPGESRSVRIGMIAVAGGDQTLKVVAVSADSALEQSAQSSIRVLAPSLTLEANGPNVRYINRSAKYTLTVTNNSNATSENVRISQNVPAAFDFVKAGQSGHWDATRRVTSWFVGQMQPGQSQTVELELVPKEIGEFRQQFKVTGDAGVEAASVVTTRVEGAASLVMEVKDADDPIEVGTEMTYSIKVRNEGSKSANNVAISCELPPDVELVDVDGPTQHLVESGMLIFKPVAQVAANDSVTFRVTVKATAGGTMKLRARLTSQSIQKPLIVEEATQFYAE